MDSRLADRIRGVLQAPGTTRDRLHSEPPPGSATPPACAAASEQDHLESTLDGRWRQSSGGTCFVVEARQAPGAAVGDDTIGGLAARFRDTAPDASLLSGDSLPISPVFLDLETTGLNGGAGTYAFLVGCGRFDESGAFVTRQHLLVRAADEPSLLESIAGELVQAGALVTFNGKSFDAPMLETRYLYHRLEWHGAGMPHLDMLHVARRIWGPGLARGSHATPGFATPSTMSGCSLTALEEKILGMLRDGDVDGFEIPSRYFHFVRTGDARPLKVVFEHNRLDLLSLARLTVRALTLVRSGAEHAVTASEALGLGRIYERAGLRDRATAAYRRAVELGSRATDASGPDVQVHLEALRSLAVALRRSREYAEAAGRWQQILDFRNCPTQMAREASEALAIHHEHRVRDLATARTFALRSLDDGSQPAWTRAVRHRLDRLDRKLRTSQAPGFTFEMPGQA